jgi:uncharacterized protein (DUF983 family)
VSRAAPSGWARALARGAVGRCPRCGAGRLTEHWFRLRPACPRCALTLEPDEGSWTGAVVVNFALTGAVFIVTLIVLVAVTAPQVPVGTLLAVLVPLSALAPLAFIPVSKTIWLALEFAALGPR